MNFDEETQKFILALKAKVGDTIVCPICHKQNFRVINGYFCHYVQTDPGKYNILGGPAINSMMLVCQHCGYMLGFELNSLYQTAD